MGKQCNPLLSKISILFLNRSIICLDKFMGNLDKLCSRRCGEVDNWPNTYREGSNHHFQEEQCVTIENDELIRVEQEQTNEQERDGVLQLGFEDRSNRSSMKPAETSNRSLGKLVGEDIAAERVQEEQVYEREMRVKACTEVMGRLKEIEVMESSDLNQVVDLNEVVLCYSLIRNGFFIDLVNQFITDISLSRWVSGAEENSDPKQSLESEAIKGGLVAKIRNVDSGGRPTLRFKPLKTIYESEDAKNIGSRPLFQQQEAAFTGSPFGDRFKTEMAFLPMVDKTVKSEPETWELNVDGTCGTRSDCEDLSGSDMTLRELKRRCKAKRVKLPKSNDLTNHDIETCSSPDGNVQPNGDDSDLEISISSLKSKLSKKPKSKRKCIRKRVFTSPESAASPKAFAEQISPSPQESIQTITDIHEVVTVKSEPFEPDCNVVCIADVSTCISYLDKDFGGEMSHEVHSRVNGGKLGAGESTSLTEESPSCVVNEIPFETLEIGELGTGESTCLAEESPSCVVNEVPFENLEIGELGTGDSTSLTEESPSCAVNDVPFESLEIGEYGTGESTSLTEESPSCVVNEVPLEYLEIGEPLSLPVSDAEIVEGITEVELSQLISQESLSSPVFEPMREGNIADPISLCSPPTEAVPATMDPDSEIYRSCKDYSCLQGISCLMDNGTVTQMSEMSIDDNLGCNGQSNGGDGCDSEMIGEGDSKEDTPPSFEDHVNNSGNVYISSHNSNSCFSLQTGSDSVDHFAPTVETVEMYSSLATDEPVSGVVGAVDFSSETSPDATNRLSVMEALENHHGPQLEYPPKRLFSTRKAISPSSQAKLRHAVDADELYDNIEHSSIIAGLGLEGAKVTISPDRVLKKRKIVKNGSSQLVPKGILKAPNVSFLIPRDGTECASIHTCAQKAVAFSQRQMHDIEGLAMKLMRQLKSMKEIVEETLLAETLLTDSCSSTHLKCTVDKVRMATENASEAEETTRRWLSMMSKDCNRFCKIMRSTEKKAAASAAAGFSHEVHKERRKITFADEAGGILCQVKVFEDHSASLLAPESEKVNQEKLTTKDAATCTLHS
ncbi:hypothetical protein BVC80_1715g47 [Macleaya cordata]|uniref:Uncharacterized protein n=1 Tax=Macleaya cordata TaxID=56857 RepID=A0A200Q247_MACCD|nr:hypothetical protein BVC80_1715g47 [Macleaya cordata]